MGHGRIRGTLAAAGLAAAIPTGASQSQEAEGGVSLTLDVNTSLRAHSNIDLDPADPGATVRAQTALTFGLESETRSQRLAISLGTVLRAADGPGIGSTGITDPVFSLSYNREMARAALSFDASYTQADVDGFSQVFDPNLGTTSLIVDDGTRATYRLGTSLAIGTTGPFGVTLTLGDRGVRYSGTSSTALFDQRTVSATLAAELRMSEVLSSTASIFASRYTAEDAPQTTRDTTALSFGLVYTPDARTTVQADLGARQIDDSVTGDTEATEGSLSLTRALPRGSLTARVSRQLTVGGRQDQFELARSFTFPSAALEIAVGVTDTDGADLEPTASLSFSQELPRGEITASLASDVSVDDQANVQQTLVGALDYTRLLDSRSQINFGVTYVDVNDLGNTGLVERQRGSFSASFDRALAQDWSLSVGAERRFLSSAGTTTWDNAVFVGLNRSFAVRP